MNSIYFIGTTLLMALLFLTISLALVQFLVLKDNPFRRLLCRIFGAETAERIIRQDLSDNNRIFRSYQDNMDILDHK